MALLQNPKAFSDIIPSLRSKFPSLSALYCSGFASFLCMMRIVILKWVCVWLICGCALRLKAVPMHSDDHRYVNLNCSKMRYPTLCVQALMNNQDQADDMRLILVDKAIQETKGLHSSILFSSKLENKAAVHQHHLSIAAAREYCIEAMNLSLRRLNQSAWALKKSPKLHKQDIQTWLSAVLTFQQGCLDEVNKFHSYQNNLIALQIAQKMNHLIKMSSNALALVNNITTVKATKTKANQKPVAFPSWVSTRDQKFLHTDSQKDTNINAVVAQDGSGDYETIKEAINAAHSGNGRYVIYVKAGVYEERIQTDKDGITLIGEGKYSTVIVANNGVEKDDCSLEDSATFTTTGDRFVAVGISFQNSAGPRGGQAIALHVSSDHAVIYNCSIIGYQDSLYAKVNRQFYKDCDIIGTIDFIFGAAAAVFQNCNLLFRRPDHKQYNVILANGRSHPEQNSGFSVLNCKIKAAEELQADGRPCESYLGRPWKQYSRSAVIDSEIGDVVAREGWQMWPEADYSKTLYFAEYGNVGDGASTSGRVKWKGFHVIETEDAEEFTVENFIAGTSWISPTGIPFSAGLTG